MTLATRKDYFGCPGELFWLARRIKSKQFRTCLTYASLFSLFCPCLRQNANTMLSLQLLMKFSNIVRVETSRYLIKITILRRPIAKVLAAKHTLRHNYYVRLVATKRGGMRVPDLKRGGKLAHRCTAICKSYHSARIYIIPSNLPKASLHP